MARKSLPAHKCKKNTFNGGNSRAVVKKHDRNSSDPHKPVHHIFDRQPNHPTQVIHCLVLDYLPDDIQRLRDKGIKFDALDAKEGHLKLADFGNAVHFGTVGSSSYQVTRYYRPPELLFGSTVLTPAIDRYIRYVSDICKKEEVKMIVEVLGYPSTEEIKAMAASRPRVRRSSPRGLAKFIGAGFDEKALSLLQNVLIYDPTKRKTAAEVLELDYFDTLKKIPVPMRSNNKPIPQLTMTKWHEEENDTL
ncbi:hypothetical protein NECAME_11713 [Necator americanus]|uniref:Protein kinase domain-containing protein n=1 Tax=Necator americanus TaxID=51031 RepID=W2T5Y7_NECAM|nr:hypothetical protein NECAME_11713 [Necator americanus]ETN76382.1 hypothetical protein NECAME_11713 [Necator americanus]